MARYMNFMIAARQLLSLSESLNADSDDSLKAFYQEVQERFRRTDMDPRDHTGEEGYTEWCEFWARINVRWSCWVSEGIGVRPDINEVRSLLQEVVGDQPRRGKERWLVGI